MTFIGYLASDIYLTVAIVIVKMSLSVTIGVLTTCMATEKTIKKHLNFFSGAWSSGTPFYHFNRKHNA